MMVLNKLTASSAESPRTEYSKSGSSQAHNMMAAVDGGPTSTTQLELMQLNELLKDLVHTSRARHLSLPSFAACGTFEARLRSTFSRNN